MIEMAGLAPVPFAGLLLADFGASVIRVDKPNELLPINLMGRKKRSICIDVKNSNGVGVVKKLCRSADILLDSYRPGVMEKFGMGPDILCSVNPRLIYARLTGFGQNGPLSSRAGHDINYLAISGILSALGKANDKPFPPINLLADFAGGSLMCLIGILMALMEREKSGLGQVVDASMTQGVAYLSTFLTDVKRAHLPVRTEKRGSGMLDGGAPFYTTYETSDGEFMAVGAIEPQFYRTLLQKLGLDDSLLSEQMDMTKWESTKEIIARIFLTKTREDWTKIFSDVDACVEPVLSMKEAPQHPHNRHTKTFSLDPEIQEYFPNPAPVLSRTPANIGSFDQPDIGQNTMEILTELQYTKEEISKLITDGAVKQNEIKSKM